MPSQFTQQVNRTTGFDFVAAHFACEQDPWSPTNPDGYVNLGSAQNLLAPAALTDVLNELEAPLTASPELMKYQAFTGMASCRQAVADYVCDLAGRPESDLLTADQVIVGNGLIGLLEAIGVALLDPGDSVLVGTPVFPGLVTALSLRLQRSVEFLPAGPEDDWRPSPQKLDERLREKAAAGERVRAMLLCSPGNPMGYVLSEQTLHEFSHVAARHDCALIVDEVYASSVFGAPFFTAAAMAEPHVIVLGGLSKDFGVAGFATGWACIRDPAVRRAVAAQSHFYRLPTLTQRLTEQILQPDVRNEYLRGHRQRLLDTANFATQFLCEHGIAVAKADAGLCLWLDLQDVLRQSTAAGELQLYRFLLEEYRVHVSPGSGFHSPRYGDFRLCFTQPQSTLRAGLRRLVAGVNAFRCGAAVANTESAPRRSTVSRVTAQ